MTMTKTFASKLAVALVAVAMVVAAFASTAKAQTTDELQAMINDLLAQVAALQAGAGQEASASAVCPYTWTRDLSTGSTGSDVMMLQQFLNSDADTRVAAEGAGSAGMETEYYGPATAAAVSKFQVKYRSEVLSPSNLVNPTGYFGPSTRAKANALCVTATVVEDDEEAADDEEADEEDEDMTLSGEASLDTFEVEDADDDELEEGAEDETVAEITIEFEDGDAEITRMDVTVDAGSVDSWDVLETVSLWVDGDKVAERDADDEDEYQSDEVTLRFSGLSIIAEEEEELEIVVAVTLQGNIDSSDRGDVDVSVDSIRFFDADGVATTEDGAPVTDDTATFTIVEEGVDDELIVKTSSNDPDSTTLELEDDSDSDWITVFTFDLDTDDSENDIELNEVPVTIVLSSSTYADIIDDAELVIDGVTIDDFEVDDDSLATVVLTFDVDGDVTIDAGDRVEAELVLKFQELEEGNEGMTVQGKVTSANADAIDAEGADDLDDDQTSGSATGDEHTLRTEGLVLDIVSIEADEEVRDSGSGDLDYGVFVFEFEVTAFNDDFYMDEDIDIIDYDILVDGTAVAAASSTATIDIDGADDASSADKMISEGETVTFTVTIETDTSLSGDTQAVINSVSYSANGDDTTEEASVDALPEDDWTSDSLILN